MSFTRAKPSGWVTLDQITPAQINQIDVNQSNAIDGAAGGDYSPTNPIGLSNDLEIKSGATLHLESGAAAEFRGPLDMIGSASIQLGTGGEVFTSNARTNRLYVPLTFRSKRDTTASGTPSEKIDPVLWNYGNSGAPYFGVPVQIGVGSEEWIVFAVPSLPPSATIAGFGMKIDPASHTDLPATRPSIALVRYTAAAARTVVSSVVDPSADVTAYNPVHDVTQTGLSEACADRLYTLEIRGESGADSAVNLSLLSMWVDYTTTRVNHQWFESTLA